MYLHRTSANSEPKSRFYIFQKIVLLACKSFGQYSFCFREYRNSHPRINILHVKVNKFTSTENHLLSTTLREFNFRTWLPHQKAAISKYESNRMDRIQAELDPWLLWRKFCNSLIFLIEKKTRLIYPNWYITVE